MSEFNDLLALVREPDRRSSNILSPWCEWNDDVILVDNGNNKLRLSFRQGQLWFHTKLPRKRFTNPVFRERYGLNRPASVSEPCTADAEVLALKYELINLVSRLKTCESERESLRGKLATALIEIMTLSQAVEILKRTCPSPQAEPLDHDWTSFSSEPRAPLIEG